MRRVAQELGVEAMSLYHHVPNKEAILDGVVDRVFEEIEMPDLDGAADWRDNLRSRARSTREVLSRHRWALGLMDSRRNPGPATLRHHDAVLGVLRRAGFTLPMAAHAVSVLDSYVGGFVLQESALPATTGDELEEVAKGILEEVPGDALPYLRELIEDHALDPGYDPLSEFDAGLELILDALDQQLN